MVALSATLTEINADLTVLLKKSRQYLDAEVVHRFNVALNTDLEDECHTKEQQQQHILALSTEIESFGQKSYSVARSSWVIPYQMMQA